ncbi:MULTISPECIES: 50S ribosomal protein L24e [Acidianus]|uniref:Large ribosomal subunit protein eL24 n=2 Tax=Acidianus TaxID=12914 RepID=A0A2U9IMG2_9CREN|nr:MULTISPECIES: 50S ribosomal protein L24e [Acidianus]ARM75843.1 50S ribosomal protein L24 [Acidianus manzaensis]AWR97203.1 50S ribosomal protein L24e [Acidianus sulfidivorans JP7]
MPPITHKCNYCGKEILPGTGMMYVRNDGTILWFCSSKCRKYMLKYHKDPRKLKWTSSYIRVRK